MNHNVDMLLLQNDSVCVGSTHHLQRRCQEHLSGNGSKATRESKPVRILYTESHPTMESALRREHQLKRWTKAKKLALWQSIGSFNSNSKPST